MKKKDFKKGNIVKLNLAYPSSTYFEEFRLTSDAHNFNRSKNSIDVCMKPCDTNSDLTEEVHVFYLDDFNEANGAEIYLVRRA